MKKIFIQQVIDGEVSITEIDDFINDWHNDLSDCNRLKNLNDFLGLTKEEYKLFVKDKNNLQNIINNRKKL
jgi:hydroxymethylglutaryl-CoA reductase